MSQIPTQSENPNGFHQRYHIVKFIKNRKYNPYDLSNNEPEFRTYPVDSSSEYFVLRLDEGGKDRQHIKACRVAINAYADAIEHHLPELAKDLRERYPLLSPPSQGEATPLLTGEEGNNFWTDELVLEYAVRSHLPNGELTIQEFKKTKQ